MIESFWPPKPKLLLSTASTAAARGVSASESSHDPYERRSAVFGDRLARAPDVRIPFRVTMARRDLNLNSLGRYAKQSSRLVLEQHSHCEVPAGCGGVVLRWRSEISEVPVQVNLFCSGKAKLFIDGVAPASSQAMAGFGDHVLSVVLDEASDDALLAVAVVHAADRLPPVSQQLGELLSVLSDADGTWRCATAQPADDRWMRAGFDDSAWDAMALAPVPPLQEAGGLHARHVLGDAPADGARRRREVPARPGPGRPGVGPPGVPRRQAGGNGMTRPPLVLVPQHFGSTVFDRRTSRYTPFDPPATDFLRRLCHADVEAVLGSSDPASCGAMLEFYRDYYDRGFFTVDGRFAGVALDATPPADHLLGPLALHLEVVAACNLKCSHCFAGELPRRDEPLSLAQLDDLFSLMAAMGTFRLGLTGGEPLLRKDIFEVVDLALSHGLCPCLTTNGLLITEEIARQFGQRELVWLNVSLDGATAATNDPVRGSGTFDRVVERLNVLREHCRFTLAFTVMSTNAHEVRACARLAERVGAGTAVFRPLYPVGIARHHLDLMPTFRQYSDALSELDSMRDDDLGLNHIDPFSPARRREASGNVCQNHGCGAGNTVCSVLRLRRGQPVQLPRSRVVHGQRSPPVAPRHLGPQLRVRRHPRAARCRTG